MSAAAEGRRRLAAPDCFDLAGTAGGLALVSADPTLQTDAGQVWWATRTPEGPGTLHVRRDGGDLVATGYGPGGGWLLEQADAIVGLRDDLHGFDQIAKRHPAVHRLARTHAGLRLPRSGRVFHHLVPAILGQKVTRAEAHRSYRRMLRQFGEPAPGPNRALRLPPDPPAVAATPYWAFHPFGVEQRRAETIRRAAAYAAKLELAVDAGPATHLLTSLPGIGPWTAAEVVRVAYGDADAVSVGDYHLPDMVAYALAGEARGDDARMLELLEPFRGHRGRVCRLLFAGGTRAPRFGPHATVRSFANY